MAKKLKIDAWQKFQNPLLTQYNVEQLAELKRSNWSGLLLGIDQLYSTMYHEWDSLQKDVNDIAGAVRTLEWTVMPYCRDGEMPTPEAQEVARVVTDALWKREEMPLGAYSHSFPELVEAMVHAVFRGFNVHQIEWANDGKMVYPARYIQLPPQFLIWETGSGKPDRLLLVPDGQSGEGVPFEQDRFIVALNNSGPDHPVYNATFYSLVNWFLAYKFGLGWFMQFTQKFGMPKQVFHYTSPKDKEALIAEMEDERALNSLFIRGDRKYELVNAPQGGASLPQAVLLERAEQACHKAVLGQTLTSDTSSHGGSLAQAKVHAGVRAELVLHHAEFIADVLNRQLVPAIVRANYGRVEGLEMPELRCKLPKTQANIELAQAWQAVLNIPGMKVKKSEVYESLGVTAPEEGEDVFEAPAQNAGHGGMPGMEAMAEESPALPEEESAEEIQTAKKKIDAAQAWLEPLKKQLREARANGASLAEIREQVRSWKPDTKALAGAFANNIERGLMGSETAKAANPYGCNQYGEGWASEHNGLRSEPGKPMKKGDKPKEEEESEEFAKAYEAWQAAHCNQYEHAPDCENTGKANGVKKKLGEVKQALEKLGQGNESLRKGLELTAKLLDGYMRDFAQAASEAERTAILAEAQDMVDYAQDLLGDVEKLGKEEQEPKAKRYFPEAKDLAEATKNTQALAEGATVNWGEGFPVHIVNQYNEAMGEMMEKYPLRAKFVRLGAFVGNKGATLAHCRAGAMGGDDVLLLELNKNHDINGIHALSEGRLFSEEEQARTGYTRHNVGATEDGMTVRAVTIHEYGHGIKAWCNLRSTHSDMFDIDEVREARSALDEWSQAVKSARESGFKVSQYGDTDDEEFFAECFAARELGEKLPEGVERAMNKLVVLALKK